MARSHAKLLTTIWNDDEFRSLPIDAQWLYMALLSQPNLSHAGVLSLTSKRWAGLAKGQTPATIRKALERLITERFVLIDNDTEEVAIRSFLRHDGGLKIPNVCRAIARDIRAISSERLRRAVIEGIPEPFPEPLREGLAEPFPEPFPEPSPEPPENPSGNPSGNGLSRDLPKSLSLSLNPVPCPLPPPVPPEEPSAKRSAPVAPKPATDDDPIEAAITALADRAIARANGTIRNPTVYRRSCLASARTDHVEALQQARQRHPTWTGEQLADAVDPPAHISRPAIVDPVELARRKGAGHAALSDSDALDVAEGLATAAERDAYHHARNQSRPA